MMRLLTTEETPVLEKHNSEAPPPYCVLSHRWLPGGEIDFHDFEAGNFDRDGRQYRKILGACRLARKLGFRYIWIDSCCIDKSRSTEYDFAIKSMFKWYRNAELCITYLGDIHSTDASSLHDTEWFERGWTLQELIAPRELWFYNMDWKLIGSRTNLSHIISTITRIGQPYLDGTRSYRRASIAQRLSWAAGRITTVPADRAYCLMGLLQVKISPDYTNTFQQAWYDLQLEILKQSNDESIFAWVRNSRWAHFGEEDHHDRDTAFGLLAHDPSDFLGSSNICSGGESTLSYRVEKKTLRIEQRVYSKKDELKGKFKEYLDLACYDDSRRPEDGNLVRITLQRIHGLWYRVDCLRPLHTGHWTRRAGIFTRHRQEFVCEALPGVHKDSERVRLHEARAREFHAQGAEMGSRLTVMGAVVGGAALFGFVRKQARRHEQRAESRRREEDELRRSRNLYRQQMFESMEEIDRLEEWASKRGDFVPRRLSDSRERADRLGGEDRDGDDERENERGYLLEWR